MRYALLGLILFVCGTVYGGEEASVLVNNDAPAPTVAPATPCNGDCVAVVAPRQHVRTRTRYRVVNEGCDACTGRATRSVARGVVRGAGEAVTTVGGVALDVITLPARVCRGGRCN